MELIRAIKFVWHLPMIILTVIAMLIRLLTTPEYKNIALSYSQHLDESAFDYLFPNMKKHKTLIKAMSLFIWAIIIKVLFL
jgi:cytochrome c-type biogenesis protein CcmH/NrfG